MAWDDISQAPNGMAWMNPGEGVARERAVRRAPHRAIADIENPGV